MKTLKLLVCENYYPEIQMAVSEEKFDDVSVISFPVSCENRSHIHISANIIQRDSENDHDSLIICGRNCWINSVIKPGTKCDIRSADFCASHLVSEECVKYIVDKGGYVISSGWLKNWRERLADSGFDRETAIKFYGEFCRELVYFDTGAYPEAEKDVADLSDYLGIHYLKLDTELENLKLLLRSAVYEWRLRNSVEQNDRAISELQEQCAEYSAMFDLMGRIATFTNKRDAIEKIKEIFTVIFGAGVFRYWNTENSSVAFPDVITRLLADRKTEYILSEEIGCFFIKIEWNGKLFGILEAGNFMFAKYIGKYLNFALEIVKICGLLLSNIEQYEKVLKSERELHYLSYHDALTGLYNRAYLNEQLARSDWMGLTVFMFDIDRLKFVNDNYGHQEGDRLIMNVATMLKKHFRQTDIITRVGGDEFVALIPEADPALAKSVKQRINDEIAAFNRCVEDPQLGISVSSGYGISSGPDIDAESMVHQADALMYEEKAAKKRTSAAIRSQ